MKGITVQNMTSGNGNDVPSQFEIITPEGVFFQSYSSIIAFKSRKHGTFLDENKWDYSRTTMKYLSQFLEGVPAADIRKRIKAGVIKLTDLNVHDICLTPEDGIKHRYIDNSGENCPHCKSTNLERSGLEADSNVVTQYVECKDCHKTWSDIFTLTNVQL